ncbi:L-fuculose-phosphate aldolase [Tistlia consotensis]|uniref:L-fuculose-phosphate aldolase n=1 Tax=Tistlia consotensis USBA 355 TaxID=560819 RepID=A0A1Y6C6W9_9PROT|nr:class II aldolase/adducin family protein [Tistlia consotensis]SMF46438.1 L-fuculose-phosphate aldolase [Tistlia consotensis USBA 355]SNR78439.1 L-fuculose-phosphate aldolase [Tistlia consotensis]
MKQERLRREIVATARRMNALGINQGSSGNIGVRVDGGLLVTPSGVDYEAMKPADIVAMDLAGEWSVETAGLRPSSEWRIHRDILTARDEIGAVVHSHPTYGTALACQGKGIPAFHYMVAIAGGDSIRCSKYKTFGTEELSREALKALRHRKACLLAHHGMIACGADLAEALKIAVEVETLARQFWHVLLLGKPKLLSKTEMNKVLEKFAAGYGYASGPEEAVG